MINNKKIIAITPLRGNSKTVKNKNLKPLGGKPLLSWPIQFAKKLGCIDRVLVSTDNVKIAEESRDYGAEVYVRPDYLATDQALVVDVIRHLYVQLCQEGENDFIFILLEATSPFRSEALINKCLHRLVEENLDSIASFSPAKTNPHRTWKIEGDHPTTFVEGAIPWLPRQQLPKTYELNGAVYAFYPDRLPSNSTSVLFGRMGACVTEETTIDIDTEEDFIIANALLAPRKIPELI